MSRRLISSYFPNLTMPALRNVKVLESMHDACPTLDKRGVNLNPFHYLTLPLKNNWNTIAPKLSNYRSYINIVAVLLGGISLLTMLQQRNWKPPRWPWANDGRNKPLPDVFHPNQVETVDSLVEKKLLEVFEEIQRGRDKDEDYELEEEDASEAEEQVVDEAKLEGQQL